MRFPDPQYLQRVETLTDRIEEGSAAEVVVTIASRSGSYRDVDMAWAAVLALVTLVAVVFLPDVHISEVGLIPNMAVAYGLGWFLSRRVPAMRRLFTTAQRRRQQVIDAARLAFLGEALDATAGRAGILIYLSLLERDVEIVADHGVVGTLGLAPLHEFRHAVRQADDGTRLEAFMTAFERCGEALKTRLPITAETVHGIPNRPRVVKDS